MKLQIILLLTNGQQLPRNRRSNRDRGIRGERRLASNRWLRQRLTVDARGKRGGAKLRDGTDHWCIGADHWYIGAGKYRVGMATLFQF